jgi:hypothetical protein
MCGKNIFPVVPAMIKEKISELAELKRVERSEYPLMAEAFLK